MLYLTGQTLCRLMRRHHVTIRLVAQRLNISMKRVRFRRQEGIADRHVARDWIEAITGQDPGMLHGPGPAPGLGGSATQRGAGRQGAPQACPAATRDRV